MTKLKPCSLVVFHSPDYHYDFRFRYHQGVGPLGRLPVVALVRGFAAGIFPLLLLFGASGFRRTAERRHHG